MQISMNLADLRKLQTALINCPNDRLNMTHMEVRELLNRLVDNIEAAKKVEAKA